MKLFILSLVLYGALNTFTLHAQTQTNTGVDLYNKHQFNDAIKELDAAIKLNPKDGKAYYYRGMSKMMDQRKGYCKDLEKSLELGYANTSDIYYYGCNTRKKSK